MPQLPPIRPLPAPPTNVPRRVSLARRTQPSQLRTRPKQPKSFRDRRLYQEGLPAGAGEEPAQLRTPTAQTCHPLRSIGEPFDTFHTKFWTQLFLPRSFVLGTRCHSETAAFTRRARNLLLPQLPNTPTKLRGSSTELQIKFLGLTFLFLRFSTPQ
jgi:hypothetical protein